MSFKFEIHYKTGKENRVADALSRRCEVLELNIFWVWHCKDLEDWDIKILKEDKLTSMKRQIPTGQTWPTGYSLKYVCLLYKYQLVLPKEAFTQIPKLIQEFHSSPLAGHLGYLWTNKRLAENVHGRGCNRMCKIMKLNAKPWAPPDGYNHYPCPSMFGKTWAWAPLFTSSNVKSSIQLW